MAFQPFQNSFAEIRIVEIPPGLDDAKRAAFVGDVRAALELQASLAEKCDAILRVEPDFRESGDRLLIRHEPAAPLRFDAITTCDDLPDVPTLCWLTWAMLRAQIAAEPARHVHGGIQPVSVLVDPLGRPKLADLALVGAYQKVCGLEARRYLVCAPAPDEQLDGVAVSAVWTALDEQSQRDFGWISPYFALEVLTGEGRLTLQSDQFSIAAVLYQIATGEHPYGAELSDPSIMFHLQLEPYALIDLRSDWSESFERRDGGVALAADKPILEWSDLIVRMLAAEPVERFESSTKAQQSLSAHVPASWAEANESLGEAYALLEAEEYDALLSTLGRWNADDELPALWRDRLGLTIQRVEKLKAEEAELGEVRRLMKQGIDALERLKLDEARRCAEQVTSHARCTEELGAAAAKLLEDCEVAQVSIVGKADLLAEEYMTQARAALDRHEFDAAREVLDVVLSDPAMSEGRIADAQTLRSEVDRAEQLEQHAQSELETAAGLLTQHQYEDALKRLEALRDEPNLPPPITEKIGTMLEELAEARRVREQAEQVLAEASAALDDGQLDQAGQALDTITVSPGNEDLEERAGALRGRLQRITVAEQSLQAAESLLKDDPAQAIQLIRALLAVAGLPADLRSRSETAVVRCEEAISAAREAELRGAADALRRAEDAFEQCDAPTCLKELETVTPVVERMAPYEQELIRGLPSRCERLQEVSRLADLAEESLGQRTPEGADDVLAVTLDELPKQLLQRVTAIRVRVDAIRTELHGERIARWSASMEQAEALLDGGELDEAAALLGKLQADATLTNNVQQRFQSAKQKHQQFSEQVTALAAVETALQADAASRAAQSLAAFDKQHGDGATDSSPAWLRERIADCRTRVSKSIENARAAAVQRVSAALDAAGSALEDCDAPTATSHLKKIEDDLSLAPEFAGRHEKLGLTVKSIDTWLSRVTELDTALANNELAGLDERIRSLTSENECPPAIRGRLKTLARKVAQALSAHRAQLDSTLESLAGDLNAQTRRDSRLRLRIDAIASDAVALEQQQSRARDLLATHDALPAGRNPLVIGSIAAAVALIIGTVGFMTLRNRTEPVTPSIPPWKQLDNAKTVLERRLDEVRTVAAQQGRDTPPWRIRFDRNDGFPVSIDAFVVGSDNAVLLGEIEQAQIDNVAGLIDPDLASWNLLFPYPDPKKLIKDALRKIQAGYLDTAERSESDGWEPRGPLVLVPPDGFPTELRFGGPDGEVGVQPTIQADGAAELTAISEAFQQLSVEHEYWDSLFTRDDVTPPGDPPASDEVGPLPPGIASASAIDRPDQAAIESMFSPLLPALEGLELGSNAQFLELIVARLSSEEPQMNGDTEASIEIRIEFDEPGEAVTESFVLQFEADKWKVQDQNAAAFNRVIRRAMEVVVQRLVGEADSIDAARLAGELVAAQAALEQTRQLRDAFNALRRLDETAQRVLQSLDSLEQGLPRRWSASSAGQLVAKESIDAPLGYPTALAIGDRELLLVNVWPQHPVWDSILSASREDRPIVEAGQALLHIAKMDPVDRRWYFFYVDARERDEAVESVADAARSLQTMDLEVPSLDEWLLAALVLGGDRGTGFIGGNWDWCLVDGEPWVAGGTDELHGKYIGLPADDADAATRWKWLTNPLMSQPRSFHDRMTAVRAVYRPAPLRGGS